jgi:two-component system chemotaxis sensor kinase CheA
MGKDEMNSDPYRYFRTEARDLLEGLTRGVLDIEKGQGEKGLVARLLRYAHTLKGAARVVKQVRISELSHSIEEVLAAHREGPGAVPGPVIGQLLGWVDAISLEVAALGQPSQAQRPPAATALSQPPSRANAAEPGDEQFETIRTDMKDMDGLLRTASELRLQMAGLSRLTPELEEAARLAADLSSRQPDRRAGGARRPAWDSADAAERLQSALRELHLAFSSVLGRSRRELESLCEQTETMRLVAANSLFSVLERTARDAAETAGKRVSFEASGGETRLDARVLQLLRNALIHLVRNAVAHGVESPAERELSGKPQAGRVQVRVERRGDRAVFSCVDDGRGVDLERVRQVILERGLVSPAEAAQLTSATAVALLLRGGITTTRNVSQLSGRGVGLEVAREAVAALNGSITGNSEPGKGVRIQVSVPVMVESQEVLHVQAGGALASIPLRAVKLAVRLTPAEIADSPEGRSIAYRGRAVRYAPLGRFLKGGPGREASRMSVLVLESGDGAAAVGVERILGRERVVIRAIPRALGPMPTVSGAFFNSQGSPQPVLSPEGLVQAICSVSGPEPRAGAAKLPRLLVIDDSLTTRLLERDILETAGYEVDTASSGEEALEKARHGRYGLFLVDLEMPGMDGYQFIQAARAQPELASIPSIIVTSRSSAEDRAAGAAVGAGAYIVKSEFDEQLLLATVRRLAG